jgi:hypothetical protein
MDDLMCSHKDPKVNNEFKRWLSKTYRKHGKVTTTRGKIHDYLGMTLNFSEKKKVKVDMIKYMEAMVDDFTTTFKTNDTAPTPAAEDLFTEGESKDLDTRRAEEFHTFVAKGLFACKRARLDIHPTIAVLCTRVRKPSQDDWRKLIPLLKYING